MALIGTIVANVKARTAGFVKGMKRARTALVGFGTAIKGVALGLKGLVASFAPLIALFGIAGVVGATENFNQKMRQSIAIMGDVSDTLKNKMAKAAKDVAFATKFSAAEAAEAYFFLASAGLNAEESIAALPQVAQFAQAGMFDLATATDLLTDAQSALGLNIGTTEEKMQNMVRVSDVLVKANTLANASVSQFSEALTTKVGAAFKSFGIQVEEGVAVLAAYADQGVKGAEAGTALNSVLITAAVAAKENADEFEKLGIEFFDAQGEVRNLGDFLGDLEDALSGMSDESRVAALETLGFKKKMLGFLTPLIGTSEKIKEYEANLKKAGGITKEVADKQLTPFQKAWSKLKAVVVEVGDVLAQPLFDALSNALIGVLDDVKFFIRNWELFWDLAVVQVEEAFDTIKAGGIALFDGLTEFAFQFLKNWEDILFDIGVVAASAFTGIIDGIEALLEGGEFGEAFVESFETGIKVASRGALKNLGKSVSDAVVDSFAENLDESITRRRRLIEKQLMMLREEFDKAAEAIGESAKKAEVVTDGVAGGAGVAENIGAATKVATEMIEKVGDSVEKVVTKIIDVSRIPGPAALERGTKEAFSAIQRFRRKDDIAKVEENTKEQVEVSKEILEETRKLVEVSGVTIGLVSIFP